MLRKVSSLCDILNRLVIGKTAESLPPFNPNRFDRLKLHLVSAK